MSFDFKSHQRRIQRSLRRLRQMEWRGNVREQAHDPLYFEQWAQKQNARHDEERAVQQAFHAVDVALLGYSPSVRIEVIRRLRQQALNDFLAEPSH